MKISLKETLNNNKFILLLSVFSTLFFVMAALFGDLFSAMCGALLAVLWRVDNFKLVPSVAVSLLGVTADVLINGFVPLASFQTLVIASVLCFMTRKKIEKSFLTSILTVAVAALTVFSFVLIAMKTTGSYSLDSVKGFYEGLYIETRDEFVTTIRNMLETLPESYSKAIDNLTVTDLEVMFDSFLSGLISMLVIYAFLIAGVAIKVFCRIASAVSEDEKQFSEWSFTTSNVFCYFYVALFFAVTFITGTGILAVALQNLYNIFLVVYAYIGLRAEYRLIRSRLSAFLTLLIVFGQFVVLSFVVFQILSIFGVLGTISKNKMTGSANSPDINA